MASSSPLQLIAYSKTYQRLQEIDGLLTADLTPKFNAAGTGTFSIRQTDPVNKWLQTPGCRVVVNYRNRQEMSGPIRQANPDLVPSGQAPYTIEDDWRVLNNTSAFVVPVAAYYSQGQLAAQSLSDDAQAISTVAHAAGTANGYGAYVFSTVASGGTSMSAEAAIKELVTKNLVSRLGAAWIAATGKAITVATNLDRGGNALAAGKLPILRMDTIGDGIAALLAWSGLGVSVAQNGTAGLVMDCFTPNTYSNKLTVGSGIITDGQGSVNGPKLTRAVIGGPGNGISRAWMSMLDTTGLEALYGDVIESVVDGTSAPIVWASAVAAVNQVEKYFTLQSNAAADIAAFTAAMQKAGSDGLAAGMPTSGLTMTLAETASFHYGGNDGGVQRGDYIPVELAPATSTAPAVVVTGQITSAEIKLDAESGVTATANVGERTDDPDVQLANALASLQKAMRRTAARK